MKYMVLRHAGTGRMENKWEEATQEECEAFTQSKDIKGSTVPDGAKWIKVVLEWTEYTNAIQKYKKAKRRINDMQEILGRWAKKVGKESNKSELISAEKRNNRDDDEYLEHWTIPVPRDPAMAREAWDWVEKHEEINTIKRIYYHYHHGWIVVVRVEW